MDGDFLENVCDEDMFLLDTVIYFCCYLFVSKTVSVRLIKGLIFLKFIAIIVLLIHLLA